MKKTTKVYEAHTVLGVFIVLAKSVGHAAHLARKRLGQAARRKFTGSDGKIQPGPHGFFQPETDRETGGWKQMQIVLRG